MRCRCEMRHAHSWLGFPRSFPTCTADFGQLPEPRDGQTRKCARPRTVRGALAGGFKQLADRPIGNPERGTASLVHAGRVFSVVSLRRLFWASATRNPLLPAYLPPVKRDAPFPHLHPTVPLVLQSTPPHRQLPIVSSISIAAFSFPGPGAQFLHSNTLQFLV